MKSPAQSQLRIIGGQWRGRKLGFPAEPGLRPTSDRIRETLFNWLAPIIYGKNCLDLFAGSGALGLEARSREAGFCCFIDQSAKVCKQLTANIELLKCNNARVEQANALEWIKRQPQESYALVFLDPPFDLKLIEPLCQALETSQLIQPGGYVYIETARGDTLNLAGCWQPYRQKQTGNVSYSLYKFEP